MNYKFQLMFQIKSYQFPMRSFIIKCMARSVKSKPVSFFFKVDKNIEHLGITLSFMLLLSLDMKLFNI